jgi:dTDP-4-amino-4,6-dideoxygalactose transaminase
MFDIQAALGIHQLRKLEMFWQARKRWVQMYDEAFGELPELEVLIEKENVKHAHHLYPIMVRVEDLTANRDQIMSALKEAGIGVSVHFRALHLMTYYAKNFGYKPGDFPMAEYASDRLISLPLYPKMTEESVRFVIGRVKDVIRRFRRKQISVPR